MNRKNIISSKLSVKLIVSVLIISFSFAFIILKGVDSYAQNSGIGINISGSPANAKALLDIDATGMNNKAGLLLPRMTTLERNAINAPIPESLLIYNTDTHCFEANYNGNWIAWACLGGCQIPLEPTVGTNTPLRTQIVWNWNSVSGATSYQWNTSSIFPGNGINSVSSPSYTQTGLVCSTPYTLYVWASNACGISSASTLTQTTFACCSPTSGCGGLTTLTDARDSQTYNIVEIGTQCWMAQNLNYGIYEDLPASGNQPSGYKYCQNYSGVNDSSCPIGGLYEWDNLMKGAFSCNGDSTCPACMNPIQGLCPTGWHIPSLDEWTLLERSLCTSGTCATDFSYSKPKCWVGTDEGSKLKEDGTSHFQSTNNCTPPGSCNSTGFTALPGGNSINSNFINVGLSGWWQSSTEVDASRVYYHTLGRAYSTICTGSHSKTIGDAVRCIKD